MSVKINSLKAVDSLNYKLISLKSKLSEATEKKKNYVTFYAKIKEKFNMLHGKIDDTNIQVEILRDTIEIISNRKRRSSRKKQMYVQRVIDHAKQKENALSNRLKKYRQQALEMEKLMNKISQHLTEDKRIVNQINTTQLQFQKLTTNRGMGKKTKNRRIKKNQTKTKRRKSTKRRKTNKKKEKLKNLYN